MVAYVDLASVALLTSNRTSTPAIVEPYRGSRSLEAQLLLAHSASNLRQSTEVIRDLERELKNTLKLPSFMHDDAYGTRCYQFRVKADGTLVAVFIYSVGINKLNFKEEPTQLHYIVHIKKLENPTIIVYNPAISTREEFWERFWRNPYNVSDTSTDESGNMGANMKNVFEKYLQQKLEKSTTKPRIPRQYYKPINKGKIVNLFMPSTPKPKYLLPPKRP